MNRELLKPCLICGRRPEKIVQASLSESGHEVVYVCKDEHHLVRVMADSQVNAQIIWNNRMEHKRTCYMPMTDEGDDNLPAYHRSYKCSACGEIHSRNKYDSFEFCPHRGAEVMG